MIKVYTDGGCIKNPGGKGGWGFYVNLCSDDATILKTYEEFGGNPSTTNNQMELTAIIKAMHFLHNNPDLLKNNSVVIFTDSKYAERGINEWSKDWVSSGRLDPNHKDAVKNIDLWLELLRYKNSLRNGRDVIFKWIKAHDTIKASDSIELKNDKKGNHRADELANKGIRSV